MTDKTLGVKDDQEKQRYDLVPPEALDQIVTVLTYGARKYAPDNWKHVPGWKARYFAAAMRHLWAWKRGESVDSETQISHLAHAMCCIMFMLEREKEEDS